MMASAGWSRPALVPERNRKTANQQENVQRPVASVVAYRGPLAPEVMEKR